MKSSKKAIPNLPSSSKMQMPSGGGNLKSAIKETGGMKGKAAMAVKAGGVAKKMVDKAKNKGMAKKSGY